LLPKNSAAPGFSQVNACGHKLFGFVQPKANAATLRQGLRLSQLLVWPLQVRVSGL